MKCWQTFKRWLWIAGAALAVVLAFFVGKNRLMRERLRLGLRTINAEKKAAKAEALLGKEAAVALVKADYEREIKELDDEQKREMEELANDPVRLASYIVRVATESRRRRDQSNKPW